MTSKFLKFLLISAGDMVVLLLELIRIELAKSDKKINGRVLWLHIGTFHELIQTWKRSTDRKLNSNRKHLVLFNNPVTQWHNCLWLKLFSFSLNRTRLWKLSIVSYSFCSPNLVNFIILYNHVLTWHVNAIPAWGFLWLNRKSVCWRPTYNITKC